MVGKLVGDSGLMFYDFRDLDSVGLRLLHGFRGRADGAPGRRANTLRNLTG